MEYSQIRYEKQGEVTIIAFNRPEVLNCVGSVSHTELIDAWGRFKADDTAKVAVLTGTGGKAFCTGGDLKDAAGIVSIDPGEISAHCRGRNPDTSAPADGPISTSPSLPR